MTDAEAGFAVDPRIEAVTRPWTDWPLCRVRLMDDRRFPWLLLLPRRAQAVEIHALAEDDRRRLLDEMVRASRLLTAARPGSKINIGALGNVVPQLHVHVVARHTADAAWPAPVWGAGPAERYTDDEAAALLDLLDRIERTGP